MTKRLFDKKILEFMYNLTRRQSFMNSVEIANSVLVSNKKISDRTIRRWFNHLKKNVFTYYPYIKYESLGLIPVIVQISDLKNEKLLDIIPHKIYLVKGVTFKNFENSYLTMYLLPIARLEEFKIFWNTALEKDLIKDLHIFVSRTPIAYYSPFHKIVNHKGHLEFPHESELDNSYFNSILHKNISSKHKVKLHPKIADNPFIIPVIFEYFREHKSSKKVWAKLKEVFGDSIWDNISSPRVKRIKSENLGVAHIQKIMRDLHENFDDFFQQIRIQYDPFAFNENVAFYLFLKLKNKKQIIEFSEKISKNVLSVVVFPSINENEDLTLFYILTSNSKMVHILSNILTEYRAKHIENKIFLIDYPKSAKYWREETNFQETYKQNFYRLFNPKTLTWNYDHKEYLQNLNRL